MKALKNLFKGQEGMTGLETAIVLIAFVTVAAVFGYAVLSAGLFSAERGKETIYAGLQQAKANMEVVGSVIAYGDAVSPPTKVSKVLFTCRNAIAGAPIDMTPNRGGHENRCVISLTTANAYYTNVKWAAQFIGNHDNDELLEAGEQLEITIDMADLGAGFADPAIGPNAIFNIQVKPAQGSTMTIQRTLPAAIDPVMDLDLMTGSGGNGAGGGGGGGGGGTSPLVCTDVTIFCPDMTPPRKVEHLHFYLTNNGTDPATINASDVTVAVNGGSAVVPDCEGLPPFNTIPPGTSGVLTTRLWMTVPPIDLGPGQTFTARITAEGSPTLTVTRTTPNPLTTGITDLH